MSANAFQIVTFELPDPATDSNAATNYQLVNSSLSFAYRQTDNVRTLSTNYAKAGSDRTGFLYVPDLTSDACVNASSPFVPSNVTRQANLPSDFEAVAIAPWVSPACTLEYLNSAQVNPVVVAFMFFLPNSTDEIPPAANDAAWGLGDGGQWKGSNQYPVYAIDAAVGVNILQQMSLYSGNTSSAPFGSKLVDLYGSRNYVRLFIDIRLPETSSGVPSIWEFLLIILVILAAAVALVSCTMHLRQHRRRRDLRRRILDGQVDLSSMGVKKFTAPQNIIDKMPIHPYGSPTASSHQHKDTSAPVESSQEAADPPSLYQPTCAICLDDFVELESNIRILPCCHIFHPECIDTFLRENWAVCPMCKKSVLPKGYCPVKITNSMVFAERHLRRRQRQTSRGTAPVATPSERDSAGAEDIELQAPLAETAPVEEQLTSPPSPASVGRREWARRRALTMLGPRPPAEDDGSPRQGGSRPRKLLRSMFPGVG